MSRPVPHDPRPSRLAVAVAVVLVCAAVLVVIGPPAWLVAVIGAAGWFVSRYRPRAAREADRAARRSVVPPA